MIATHGPGAFWSAALVVVAGLAAAASGADHGDAGSTLSLNKDSFDGYITNQFTAERPALIMFHVSWCKVCQKTFPKFSAASALVAEKGVPLDFAHVDCTDDKTLCKRFNVTGYPTIKHFTPKEGVDPRSYRGSRTEEGFLKYARRMTQPIVQNYADVATTALPEEIYSAFFIVADTAAAVPASFLTVAERWRDRHIFAAVPSLQLALPDSIAAPADASIAVFSSAAQQWGGAGEASPAALFYQGPLQDVDSVSSWIEKNRFPGIWALGDTTFYEFTHSSRSAVMVTMDPANVSATHEQHIRSAAATLGAHYMFGVLNGVAWADELTDFNLHKQDIPRVLVTVDDFDGWYEDVNELRVESLASDLDALRAGTKALLRQGRGVVQRLQLYLREGARRAERLYVYAQTGPREAALASAAVAAGMAAVMTLGWCAVACCRVLLSEDAEPWDRHKVHNKVD